MLGAFSTPTGCSLAPLKVLRVVNRPFVFKSLQTPGLKGLKGNQQFNSPVHVSEATFAVQEVKHLTIERALLGIMANMGKDSDKAKVPIFSLYQQFLCHINMVSRHHT